MVSGLTSNDIDAQECAGRGIKIEAKDQAEELKMADGIVVRAAGQVQFVLKCAGDRGEISLRLFSNMNKQMNGKSCGSQRRTPTFIGLKLWW